MIYYIYRNSKMALFQEEKKRGAILLVDRSGSTGSYADHTNTLTIFDRMARICGELGHLQSLPF